MMNEEEYLNSKLGKKNPFTVPEGYFEQLTEQVMKQIPEEVQITQQGTKKTAAIRQLRPWLYAAACVCVGAFMAAMLFNKNTNENEGLRQVATLEQDNSGYYSDSYIEEEADYAMIDNQEIYACLLAEM